MSNSKPEAPRKQNTGMMLLIIALAGMAVAGVWIWSGLSVWGRAALLAGAATLFALLGLISQKLVKLRFVFCIGSALLFLLAGYVGYTITSNQIGVTALIFSIVFLLWLALGIGGRSRWLTAMGWLGLILVFGLCAHTYWRLSAADYGSQHGIWMIPLIVSLGLTLACGRQRFYISPVFGLFTVLVLFVPDCLVVGSGEAITPVIAITLFLKLAGVISLFTAYRNQVRTWWVDQIR